MKSHHPKWLQKAMKADGGRTFAEKRIGRQPFDWSGPDAQNSLKAFGTIGRLVPDYEPGKRASEMLEDRRNESATAPLNSDRDMKRGRPVYDEPEADETAKKMLPGPINKNFRLGPNKD